MRELDLVADFDSLELLSVNKNTSDLKLTGVAIKKGESRRVFKESLEVEVRNETLRKIVRELEEKQ